jgi:hypothetical protein
MTECGKLVFEIRIKGIIDSDTHIDNDTHCVYFVLFRVVLSEGNWHTKQSIKILCQYTAVLPEYKCVVI